MNDQQEKTPLSPRSQSVREDWVAFLPEGKSHVFESSVGDLETSYTMLSVALNEAFLLRARGSIGKAREEAGISAVLFWRSANRLLHTLRTMHEYGRHLGHLPNVTPLVPENFRGPASQRLARSSSILCRVLFSSRSRFFHKLHTLCEAAEETALQFKEIAGEVSEGISIEPRMDWASLDTLHYDFNTCLRESIVILKSFLIVLPDSELRAFEQTMRTVPKETPRPAGAGVTELRHRRATAI